MRRHPPVRALRASLTRNPPGQRSRAPPQHPVPPARSDLKPANLLVNANCDLKITDFGLSRGVNPSDCLDFLTEYVVTRWYRAPEIVLSSDTYTKAVDMWSVGCIFSELLRRAPFFPGSSDIDQLARIFTALGTPDDAVWPGLSSLPDYIPFQPVPGTPLREIFVGADDVALDLLSKLLTLCPGERLGADEALRHPYFVKT